MSHPSSLDDTESRTPMTWAEYEALGELATRAEYFGGCLVVSGNPSWQHQAIVLDLAMRLHETLGAGTAVVPGWGWSPAGAREELAPDVMVHRVTDEQARLTRDPPLLVVEVLSTNRRTDLVDKMFRYARWGAATYWVVDPRDREVVVHALDDGLYRVDAVHVGGRVQLRYDDREVPVDLDAWWARGEGQAP